MVTSVTKITESELTDRIFADHTWRVVLGLPPRADHTWLHRLRVTLPSHERKGRSRGDVDILAMPPKRPDAAVAAEVKCVRVPASSFKTLEPNGLKNWQKGIQQANRLEELGFHQVYIYLFMVIDSREHNGGEWTYSGATPELLERVRSSLDLGKLHPRVGMVENQFVQPVDRPPLELGTAASNIVRMAGAVSQPDGLTAWVRDQFTPPAI